LEISKFGIAFLLLALRIGKHIKGYVDFYFGPKKLRQIVEYESITSPNKLLNDCRTLQKQLVVQGYDKKREFYLAKMLTAMETSIEILNGAKISLREQILRQYDVTLCPVKESELENLKEEFNEAYEGSGSLKKRMNDLRVQRTVPETKVFSLFEKALKIVRKRTKELFKDLLPIKERISLELVNPSSNEVAFSYYEWYMGNYHSRIEINPKYNMYWTSFLAFAAHEGYPGHHTQFIIDERSYRELNQFEHSILLPHSPKLIISEGMADLALNVLYSYKKQEEIGLLEFCPDSSKESSLEVMIKQSKVRSKTSLFWYNFNYHALIDEWSDEDLIRYSTNFEIFSDENIRKQLKLKSNHTLQKTVFSYNLGNNLITRKYGKFPSVTDFRKLLVDPVLPSDLM